MKRRGRAQRVPHDQFGRLLAVLGAFYIVGAFRSTPLTRTLEVALSFLALAIAVRSTGLSGPSWARFMILSGAVAIGLVALSPVDSDTARGIGYVGLGIAVLGTLVAVLRRVLAHEEVTTQTLAGALCSYVLIGFFFASVFGALDSFSSGAALEGTIRNDDYSYFSFVTLATLGYGDIVPITEPARRIAVIEALAGQIFLATTVARLVALFPRRGVQSAASAPRQSS